MYAPRNETQCALLHELMSTRSVVEKNVIPLLVHLGLQHVIHTTSGVRDAGRIGRSILKVETLSKKTVIIAGGDGTAHEMIEGILEAVRGGSKLGRWGLVILPLGTVCKE